MSNMGKTTLPEWLKNAINMENKNLVNTLESAFTHFNMIAEAYDNDSDDFEKSFHYINMHPAFWWRDTNDADSSWNTDSYNERIWIEPLSDSNGYQWALEAGAHVEDDYTHHYHDHRLDVYTTYVNKSDDNVENAYIDLAKRVHQIFDNNGNERPNIEHLNSPIMDEINQRLQDWQESTSEEED